jgi:CHAT domain-containing protein
MELLTMYFDNLGTTRLRAKAMRQVMLNIIKKRREDNKAAHPYYWAAFSLTGRG